MSGGLNRGDGQPESGDGHCERVHVDSVHRIQRFLHQVLRLATWFLLLPPVQESVECAEQEVS